MNHYSSFSVFMQLRPDSLSISLPRFQIRVTLQGHWGLLGTLALESFLVVYPMSTHPSLPLLENSNFFGCDNLSNIKRTEGTFPSFPGRWGGF